MNIHLYISISKRMCARRRCRTPPAVPNPVPRIPSSSTSGPMYLRRSKLMRQAESLQERGKRRKTPGKCRFVKSWAINAHMYALIGRFFKNWRFPGGLQRFLRALQANTQICCDSDIWAQKQWENGVRDPTPPTPLIRGKLPKNIWKTKSWPAAAPQSKKKWGKWGTPLIPPCILLHQLICTYLKTFLCL